MWAFKIYIGAIVEAGVTPLNPSWKRNADPLETALGNLVIGCFQWIINDGIRYHFHIKLDIFQIKVDTRLGKLDSFEIILNIFQTKTSFFHIKIEAFTDD